MATVRTNIDTTSNKDALRGGLRNVFDTSDRDAMIYSSPLYNMISTNEYINRDLRVAGLDYGGKVLEGQQIPIQDPKFGQKLDYQQEKWGTGARITLEMKKFNKIDQMKRLIKNLKCVMLEGKDVELAKPWVSPTSSTYTGFTSVVMGSDSQTTLDDAATGYSNLGTSALSTTSLQTAEYYFDMLVDDIGNTAPKTPDMLVFQPTLQWTAAELFKSSQMPHEMSNTYNSQKDWNIEMFKYPRLTSTTSWFLLARKDRDYDVNCFTSMAPDLVYEGPFDTTRDTLVTSAQMYDYGFGDARCIFVGKT